MILPKSSKSTSIGYLHSYETLGTQDGPGLRLVVFLQGCPLRCQYCHNPDTWDIRGGTPVTTSEIVEKARRMKPYFGATGGVTISGGEPLAQANFLLDLLVALNREQIHVALDTSGWFSGPHALLEAILVRTNLVLLDIKQPDPHAFRMLTGQSQQPLLTLLTTVERLGTAIWIRQIIVPGLNDTSNDLLAFVAFLSRWPALRIAKYELLGYHTLGLQKYTALGIDYPIKAIDALPIERLKTLQAELDQLTP
ncbi:MAG: pyruvate formate-lyase-activating protein [Eubacteriales bacterium]|nr:pyruvate formate-lyase-activating protein [Eubacteriales bacterium]